MSSQSDSSGSTPPEALGETTVRRFGQQTFASQKDQVAREEPLEIRVLVPGDDLPKSHNIAITMRTPGDDASLAAGFLFSEGLLQQAGQVARIHPATTASPETYGNILNVELMPGVPFDAPSLTRKVYTTSSCGICGKASLDIIRTTCSFPPRGDSPLRASVLQSLPAKLTRGQPLFKLTGGIHAAEDVGRHNAVDKLVGHLLLENQIPAHDQVLLMSGRASFELVQKAAMAGIPTLAAMGAPSSLAIDLARDFGMTLIGFLKGSSFNVYTGHQRIAP